MSKEPDSRSRLLILAGLAAAFIIFLLATGPIPQDQGYHGFADGRRLLGLNNFFDVASNLPFILTGVWGLLFLNGAKKKFHHPSERLAYAVVFVGVLLTGLGSSYYHENPTDQTLFWDRMPLTLVFTAFFAVTVSERIDSRTGARLLGPLLLLGVFSVIAWRIFDDLRLYVFVQFYALAAIPAMALLFKPAYTRAGDLMGTVGWYAAAKILELLDKPIFELGGLLSGHTLKHLSAGMAAYWILRMIKKRRLA